MIRRMLAALLCAACCAAYAGCGKTADTRTVQFLAMDTVMSLTVTAPDAAAVLADARAWVTETDARLSVTADGGEIAAVNAASGAAVNVSAPTAELLACALQLAQETDGAFDPTVYPLTAAWGFIGGNYRVPSAAERQELLRSVGWEKVGMTVRTDGTAAVSVPAGGGINLGGIAKGWTAAQLAARLTAAGATSALLDLGGNVQVLGGKPGGAPWTVGIRDPLDEDGTVGAVRLTDGAVVTSGGYQRYFEQDGVTYQHILDPATGAPAASDLLSVTVVSDDGTAADALATALFVMGEDKATAFCRAHSGTGAILVTADRRVAVTADLRGVFDFDFCTDDAYTLTWIEK